MGSQVLRLGWADKSWVTDLQDGEGTDHT